MKEKLFVILLLLFSCKRTVTYEENISNKLDDLDKFNFQKYSHVVIIPGSGCSGCISEAEAFFLENYENDKIFFIFTKINSLKILRLRIGDLLDRINVLIDLNDIFFIKNSTSSLYPVILNIQNNKIITYKVLDPGENMEIN